MAWMSVRTLPSSTAKPLRPQSRLAESASGCDAILIPTFIWRNLIWPSFTRPFDLPAQEQQIFLRQPRQRRLVDPTEFREFS